MGGCRTRRDVSLPEGGFVLAREERIDVRRGLLSPVAFSPSPAPIPIWPTVGSDSDRNLVTPSPLRFDMRCCQHIAKLLMHPIQTTIAITSVYGPNIGVSSVLGPCATSPLEA